jgi:hypothetical protein
LCSTGADKSKSGNDCCHGAANDVSHDMIPVACKVKGPRFTSTNARL